MKILIKSILYRLGLCKLSHKIRNKNKLTVIMLHRILPKEELISQGCDREWTLTTEEFDSLLTFLTQYYNIISEQDLLNFKKGKGVLPNYPLLLTLDDGWYDNYEYALPILQKHEQPSLIFIATNWISSPVGFWQEQIVSACQKKPSLFDDLKKMLELETVSNVSQLIQHLCKEDQEANRVDVLNKVAPSLPENRQMMSKPELVKLIENNIAIGGHGASHNKLDSLTPEQQKQELEDSFTIISTIANQSCSSMSFPHGRYNEQVIQQATKVGFSLLFSSNNGTSSFDQLVYNRIHVSSRNIITHDKFDPCKSCFFFFYQK